jgi:hypothetical protein
MHTEQGFFMSPNFLIRPSEPSDEPTLLAGFAHVFRDTRSRDVWHWIYRDNPDTSQSMLCLTRDGEFVAHSGASFHRAVYQGTIIRIGQCRDAFSLPKFRSAMQGRTGLFAQTVRSLFERFGTAEGVAFYYGFPIPSHLRLGSKQLNYLEGNNWGRFLCDTSKRLPDIGNNYGFLSVTNSFGEDFDRLWCSRGKTLTTAVIHDSLFLSWRFHPRSTRTYWIWTFTPYLSTDITGYVIFSHYGHKAMLLDFHFPEQSRAGFDFWLQIIEKLRWQGIEQIETVLSLNHPDLANLRDIGFVQQALPDDFKFAFRIFDDGPDWATLNQDFCFTLADSDLY